MRIPCWLAVSVMALAGCAQTATKEMPIEDDSAKVAQVDTDFRAILQAANLFKLDHGRAPGSIGELVNPPASLGSRYLESVPTDPWTKAPYAYELTAAGPRLISYGRDQKEGGVGFDADITNR